MDMYACDYTELGPMPSWSQSAQSPIYRCDPVTKGTTCTTYEPVLTNYSPSPIDSMFRQTLV
jgi:hypothetical protein